MPRKILLSSGGSSKHPEAIQPVIDHFAGCRKVAYIPYALADHDASLATGRRIFPGVEFFGLHQTADPKRALESADGIWVMGGNSFRLVHHLHELGLIEPVRALVAAGVPYGGVSAGSNVAGPTICTTNDMPIIRQPRSLDAFDLVPFQINPHYLPASAMPKNFGGETREERIAEFLEENDVVVIGLPEGTWLTVNGDVMRFNGAGNAALFERGRKQQTVKPGTDLSLLLTATPRFGVPPPGGLKL
jgi:dipeptidase E